MRRLQRIATVMTFAAVLLVPATAESRGATPLDLPFYRQQKDGCGAASVAMVLHYWQQRQPQTMGQMPEADEVYRALYQPELRGIPLGQMRQFMDGQGLRAYTLRGTMHDLKQQLAKGRPLIVATKAGDRKPIHFVVATGLDGDAVWMNDPTRKKPRRMALKKLQQQWARADGWMLLAVPAISSSVGLTSPHALANVDSPQPGQ